jgi:hypothetical protein
MIGREAQHHATAGRQLTDQQKGGRIQSYPPPEAPRSEGDYAEAKIQRQDWDHWRGCHHCLDTYGPAMAGALVVGLAAANPLVRIYVV